MLEQESQIVASNAKLEAPQAQHQQPEPQQLQQQSPRQNSKSSHDNGQGDDENQQEINQQLQPQQTDSGDRDGASSPQPPQIGQHNPLNEHDYCSPNKRLTQKSDSISNKSNKGLSSGLGSIVDARGSSGFLASSTFEASTSEGNELSRYVQSQNNNPPILSCKGDDGNESDSSSTSSSSLSSSAASSKDLVIAHDHQKTRPVPPKDTPSVSRPRPGRPRKKLLLDNQLGPSSSLDQGRSRRPRQNTSVTDKSEWITGDEQIDSALSEHLSEVKARANAQRRSHEESLSQYTSSDYSSSDADSDDQDSDDDSEDDPNKLWCVCRKPYDNKFMICCDVCKDWFHGHCVGVTKLMGDRFEKEGKEWFCGECQEKLRNGIPRHAIPSKIVKKEKKKKKKVKQIPGKRGRGRPRKSESSASNTATRFSLRNARRSMSSLDPKHGVDNGRLKKNLSKPDLRSESFGEFENEARLKELIKERKKEFFYKRRLAEMQKAERRNALGLGKQSLTALSDSLDHLASSTSTPNMSNLPINIKSDDLHQKERPKPNIVLQINTKKESGTDQGNSRIVTAIVKSPTKSRQSSDSATNNPTATDLFTAEPIQISKKTKTQESSISPTPVDSSTSANSASKKLQSTSTFGSSSRHHDKSEASEKATPKKKRKTSESSTPNGSSGPIGSKHIIQKIKDSLEERSRKIEGISLSADEIGKISVEIESHLNDCFKEGSQKYLNKFRSLLFNLRDQKNEALVKNVLSGEITPSRLVRMSPDELASSELAKWRERENKHSIELIKRDAQLAAQQVIVKKTHKGEEVISAPAVSESEPTNVVENQETPTTPTSKLSISKPDSSKGGGSSPASESGKPSPTLTSGKTKTPSTKPDSTPKTGQQRTSNTPDEVSSLPFIDTTKEHKSHIFDINCKICTKKEPAESNNITTEESMESEQKSEQAVPQPKRLRVSIETKLDPANLSRMKEPLIKPSKTASMDVDDHSPAHTPIMDSSVDESKDEIMYDPEMPLTNDPVEPNGSSSDQECWSGTISMPDVGTFSALARPVSGSVEFMRDEVNANLMVCGRIAPDQVHTYIKKLKSTTRNQILLIQIHPKIDEERDHFNVFFDYLYSRNRYGVIQSLPNLKDFYLLPLHEKSSIPEILKPIRGLDRSHPNCLIGLLVKCRRTSSGSSGPLPTYNPSSNKTK